MTTLNPLWTDADFVQQVLGQAVQWQGQTVIVATARCVGQSWQLTGRALHSGETVGPFGANEVVGLSKPHRRSHGYWLGGFWRQPGAQGAALTIPANHVTRLTVGQPNLMATWSFAALDMPINGAGCMALGRIYGIGCHRTLAVESTQLDVEVAGAPTDNVVRFGPDELAPPRRVQVTLAAWQRRRAVCATPWQGGALVLGGYDNAAWDGTVGLSSLVPAQQLVKMDTREVFTVAALEATWSGANLANALGVTVAGAPTFYVADQSRGLSTWAEYTPAEALVNRAVALPAAPYRRDAVALALSDGIYVVGGRDVANGPAADVFVSLAHRVAPLTFLPLATFAALDVGLAYGAGTVLNGIGFLAGGATLASDMASATTAVRTVSTEGIMMSSLTLSAQTAQLVAGTLST